MFFSRLAVLVLLSSAYSYAFPIILPRIFARHAAFATGTVAPGSFISIQEDFFSADAAHVKIELKASDGGIFQLSPVEPPKGLPDKEHYVWAVIPQGAALGPATVSLNGLNADIQIASAAPGLLTANYLGYGNAIALDRSATALGLANATAAGQEIALWGTGLGCTAKCEASVEIGGLPAQVLYAGPQGFPGLDQINVVIPEGAARGCYVPVRLRINGITSNAGSLPIAENPAECSHPLELTYADRQNLDAGGTMLVSQLRLVGRYNPTNADESAAILSSDMNASDLFLATAVQGPELNSCVAAGEASENSWSYAPPFTATITSPDGREMPVDSIYTATPDPKPFFGRGQWSFETKPSAQFAAVRKEFYLPAPLREFNPGVYITFTTGQNMLFTWDPTRFTQRETITVQLGVGNFVPECRVSATEGRLVFPAALFERYKGKNITVQLLVRPVARETFTLFGADGSKMPLVIDPVFTAPLGAYVQE